MWKKLNWRTTAGAESIVDRYVALYRFTNGRWIITFRGPCSPPSVKHAKIWPTNASGLLMTGRAEVTPSKSLEEFENLPPTGYCGPQKILALAIRPATTPQKSRRIGPGSARWFEPPLKCRWLTDSFHQLVLLIIQKTSAVHWVGFKELRLKIVPFLRRLQWTSSISSISSMLFFFLIEPCTRSHLREPTLMFLLRFTCQHFEKNWSFNWQTVSKCRKYIPHTPKNLIFSASAMQHHATVCCFQPLTNSFRPAFTAVPFGRGTFGTSSSQEMDSESAKRCRPVTRLECFLAASRP